MTSDAARAAPLRPCGLPAQGRWTLVGRGEGADGGAMTNEETTGRPRIVVGIDGSEQSKAALRWALAHSALTGAAITAVTSWQFPASYGFGYVPTDAWRPDEDAARTLEQTVAEVTGDDRPADLRAVTCQGNPAEVLIEESEGAVLLVVGSRGHGGFSGLLLGSVSSAVAERAHCPVLVWHDARAAAPQES